MQRLENLRKKNDSRGAELLLLEPHLKKEKVKIITSFNLFQTPREIVLKMLSLVDAKNKTILEPSAGLGAIIKEIKNAKSITAIDNSKDCIRFLYDNFKGVNLIEGDFITKKLDQFDLAVMNPPFKNGLDIKHILKAKSLCKEVVFLCYNGPRQNKKLKQLCKYWEVLPPKSFKSSGTNADVCIGLI